jgi:hypothetical protein
MALASVAGLRLTLLESHSPLSLCWASEIIINIARKYTKSARRYLVVFGVFLFWIRLVGLGRIGLRGRL